MALHTERQSAGAGLQTRSDEVVNRFRNALLQGEDWFDALLDTVAAWTSPSEIAHGREFRYLVGGEAFDWLLLAERLVLSADGLVPEEEREALIFSGQPPRPMTPEEFRERIGSSKHRAVMNFWYGVMVEEALILAVEHEVRKGRHGGAEPEGHRLDTSVYQRIYGRAHDDLLREFSAEKQEIAPDRLSLSELREFTYWLFKYRVRNSEPARLASDTKKGLDCLRWLGKGDGDGWG
ncbi:MAG: hypothetical protein V3V35_05415 [Dehalococcoidia bacterium]